MSDFGLVDDDGQYVELIFGEQFVAVVPTPFLAEVIENAARIIRGALEGAAVEVDHEVVFGPNTVLRPDVSVWSSGEPEGRPDLVVEVRTESTDRYALGPKRLVYSRAGVLEYWFLDPLAHTVRRMQYDERLPDYAWPPEELRAGAVVAPASFPAAAVAVSDLLAPALKRSHELLV